jgi:hypothetical protein
MQNAFQRSVKIALFSCLISVTFSSASFAQGSTGGSIGNDEKSLSGSRAPRAVETERPVRRSKPRAEPEEPRRAARKSGGGGGGRDNFDGVWVVTATGCGSTTTSTIVVTSGKIIGEGVRGTISPSGVSHAVGNYNGITVTSTGRASGRSGTGTFRTSDGCAGTLTSVKQ